MKKKDKHVRVIAVKDTPGGRRCLRDSLVDVMFLQGNLFLRISGRLARGARVFSILLIYVFLSAVMCFRCTVL